MQTYVLLFKACDELLTVALYHLSSSESMNSNNIKYPVWLHLCF